MAINYQTEDDQYGYNCARFSDNGGCGFVLKPEFLRNPSPSYTAYGLDRLEVKSTLKISIKVLSGHFLNVHAGANGNLNPYVKIRIRGHPMDEKEVDGKKINCFKCDSVESNGIHTLWTSNGDINLVPTLQFEIKMPSLAFLEIKAKDDSIGNLAMFCCPITMIEQQGKITNIK